MDEDDKKKLDRILKLTEENNEYIRKVRGSQKTSRMFKLAYWVIIIALMVGSFYLAEPYFNSLLGVYSGIGGGTGTSGFKMPDVKQLQDLVKQINPPAN